MDMFIVVVVRVRVFEPVGIDWRKGIVVCICLFGI